MKALLIPLLILVFLDVMACLIAISPPTSGFFNSNFAFDGVGVDGNLIVNGTKTSLGLGNAIFNTLTFGVGFGVLYFVIGMVAIGVAGGVQAATFGLNSVSTMILYKSVAFYGLWALLSAFAFACFNSIPMQAGYLAYFGLTLIYSVGVFNQVGLVG